MSAPSCVEPRDVVAVADPDHVLLDDRAGVELLGHVVGGGADQLDAARLGAGVRVRAGERRQERVVDVDHRDGQALEELAGQDLHVARQHDEVALAVEQLEQLRLGLGLALGVDGDVVVGHVEQLDVLAQVGVVGGDEDDAALELAAAPAPQQVEQAVVVARHQHRDPLAPRGVPQPPGHAERLGDLQAEPLGEAVALLGGERELHAQEERAALGIGRVLVRADDVRPGLVQEARDARDDARSVRAGDQQAQQRRRTPFTMSREAPANARTA